MFFAMNMGASGAAASMGVAYGSGAVKRKKVALLLSGIGVFLGAAIGGSEVAKTIGAKIIPTSIMGIEIAMIVLLSATASLFIANLLGIPLSTSEVTVGALVGVGLAFQDLYVEKIIIILLHWIFIPIISFLITYGLCLAISKFESSTSISIRWKKYILQLLLFTGFCEAFAAGMNNVSNAVGPLVGAGLISLSTGTIVGGLFIGLGAYLFGAKVIETNGKKITSLSPIHGAVVSGTGASLVIVASIFGIPIPMTQVTTAGILGIGMAQNGFQIWQKGIIKRMIKVWIVSPVSSLVISYGLVNLFFEMDFYTLIAIGSVFFATAGMMNLIYSAKKENTIEVEQRSGKLKVK